jgi:hypothetical protein
VLTSLFADLSLLLRMNYWPCLAVAATSCACWVLSQDTRPGGALPKGRVESWDWPCGQLHEL